MPDTKMRVRCSVAVGFGADSYEEAGRVLDLIDRAVAEALNGVDAHHDVTQFETRPCKAMKFNENENRYGYAGDLDQAQGGF